MHVSSRPPTRASAESWAPVLAHDDDEPHFHEWSDQARSALADVLWKTENIELTTVGIDIGSSTSHLMFSRVRLQRKTQLLSSEFIVVGRETLWRSPILLTPFRPDYSIDAAQLRAFVDEAYRCSGIAAADVDSGAVILTGEAIKRSNAQAIAQIFAAEAGKFVCALAGHQLECVLAAHGAGATAISRHTHKTVLNVDIGGGTTKFALLRNGEILGTCALAVGGRLVAQDPDGLPLRNVPVLFPALDLEQEVDAARVAAAVGVALERLDADDDRPIALGIRWRGDPQHARLHALAAGIAQAVGGQTQRPLILLVDGDVGKLLGYIMQHEMQVRRNIISIDGLQLREFDYVDIGEPIPPSGVVPVVIKSLLFPSR